MSVRLPINAFVFTPYGWVQTGRMIRGEVLTLPLFDVQNPWTLAQSWLPFTTTMSYTEEVEPPKNHVQIYHPYCKSRCKFDADTMLYAMGKIGFKEVSKPLSSAFLINAKDLMFGDLSPIRMLKRPAKGEFILYERGKQGYNNAMGGVLWFIDQLSLLLNGYFARKDEDPEQVDFNLLMQTEVASGEYSYKALLQRNSLVLPALESVTCNYNKYLGMYITIYKMPMTRWIYRNRWCLRMAALVGHYPLCFDKSYIYIHVLTIPANIISMPVVNAQTEFWAYNKYKKLMRNLGGKSNDPKMAKTVWSTTRFSRVQKSTKQLDYRYCAGLSIKPLCDCLIWDKTRHGYLIDAPFMLHKICKDIRNTKWIELSTPKQVILPVMYPNGEILFLST